MLALQDSFLLILARTRQYGRRRLAEFRHWIKETRNFVHVSLLFFIPLLIGLVTFLANAVDALPYLLFPPLASGTYTLFAQPEAKTAKPRRFVGGMTIGAICGWIALEVTARYWYQVTPEAFQVHPGAAAFGVFLTGVMTWALDLEEAQAFSTALLVLVSGVTQLVYVASVFLSSILVAGVFLLWQRKVYEQRGEYLYQTTHGDDHLLVPMRGESAEAVAAFGAHLAAAHEAGKVILLSVVSTEAAGDGVPAVDTDGRSATATPTSDRIDDTVPEQARALEETALEIMDQFDVPCEVAVVAGDPADARTLVRTAHELDCDLIVTPFSAENGRLSEFVRGLFASSIDVLAVSTDGDRDAWRRILVPVRSPSGVAHAMLDFATRLVGESGHIAVCHCIDNEAERRKAEEMLANVVETFERAFETRVVSLSIEEFLNENARIYDLTIIGSSSDRTKMSRFVNPPTFRQLDNLNCDVAIVNRGNGPNGNA
jgi:nucleotide-binding universal stress UspA family protein